MNAVIPGYTQTPMTNWVTPADAETLLRGIPLGRAGEPEEVTAV